MVAKVGAENENTKDIKRFPPCHSQYNGEERKNQLSYPLIELVEKSHQIYLSNPQARFFDSLTIPRRIMSYAANNWLIDINIAISNFYIEATIRVSAYPSFIMNWRTLTAKIGQRH
jgi:hypothetical protein